MYKILVVNKTTFHGPMKFQCFVRITIFTQSSQCLGVFLDKVTTITWTPPTVIVKRKEGRPMENRSEETDASSREFPMELRSTCA